jgi:hypothetical protein
MIQLKALQCLKPDKTVYNIIYTYPVSGMDARGD